MSTTAALALGLTGLLLIPAWVMAVAGGGRGTGARPPWDWGLSLRSALAYALAFNLVFLVQELFLVIPKALTPGLKPTLFHNNHHWSGHHPLEPLFQGTGAAATVVLAGLCALWLARRPPGSATLRLLVTWTVFHGLMEALPQAVVGAVFPGNDVGMAMDYFRMARAAKVAAALAAILAIAFAARWIAARLRALAPDVAGPALMLRLALLPAAAGVLIILPFRVPGAIDQVAIVPVAVALIGASWLQAWAGRVAPAGAPPVRPGSLWTLVAAGLVMLAVFQGVLRPGIPFY